MKLLPLLLVCLLVWFVAGPVGRAAEPAPAALAKSEETNAQEVLRAYLQLQEQIHANELAIERSQKEAQRTAEQTAQTLEERLKTIEQSLNSQRSAEVEVLRNFNRVMVIVAAASAGIGLLALALMAYFQWRTVNRLAEITAALPAAHALAAGTPLAALGAGDAPQVTVGPAEQSSQRLLGALEQLDKRLQQIEHSERPHLTEGPVSGNGASLGPVAPNGHSAPEGELVSDEAGRIHVLLGKGQSLLNLDNAEGALECFNQVLALAPKHTEALLKKGAALERLRKLEEAVACYDQALAADSSLTLAHLYKGGLLNRMERFDEALQCYELALHTQEKKNN
jgi:tetratricopeptide (TPR) repeat protein